MQVAVALQMDGICAEEIIEVLALRPGLPRSAICGAAIEETGAWSLLDIGDGKDGE